MRATTLAVTMVLAVGPIAGAAPPEPTTGTVRVVILDEDADARDGAAERAEARVADVIVHVVNSYSGEIVREVQTDESGFVSIGDLPFGRYMLIARGGDYHPVSVAAGKVELADDDRRYCDNTSEVFAVTPVQTAADLRVPIGGCSAGAWFALGPQAGTAAYLSSMVVLPILPPLVDDDTP